MVEIFRTRDVVAHFRGDSYAVAISEDMANNGWSGGQGVCWTESPSDEFMVTYSDGLFGGILLWGSDEVPDRFTGMTGNHVLERFAVLCSGNWIISSSTYERFTYASRIAPPLVPILYTPGEPLYFSLRGWYTNEDEWTLSGDPRAPNTHPGGSVIQPPRAGNDNFLVLMTVL